MSSPQPQPRLSLLRRRNRQRGFSLLELMIALTVLLIGITGILTMQIVALRATSYSRHATEAAILAEDKLEQLRTLTVTDVQANGDENVNALGTTTGDQTQDIFRRTWATTINGTVGEIRVTVFWLERGSEPHSIIMRTNRTIE